jgi:replicative DNA helicase
MTAKVPPHSKELEGAVLGAILIERNAYELVGDILKPEIFYFEQNQRIYQAMQQLAQSSAPIDIITVSELVKADGIDSYTVTRLTNDIVSSAHISSHVNNLLEKYIRREQIRISGELNALAYDESINPYDAQEDAEKKLHELSCSLQQSESRQVSSIMVEVFKEIHALRDREHYLTGITSGYSSIDLLTMGWQRSDLIIIAARPAVGKTAFTLSLALNASLSGFPAAFFSLEMSGEQLVKRVLAAQAKMTLSRIKGCRLDDRELEHLFERGIKPLANVPLFVDDTASLSVSQFKARLRRMIKRHGIKIAFVDYLQLLKSNLGKNTNRQQQIGEISRELKITSKELNIPIIALSQLSREVEKRANGTPQLSDLREAGDIEQDADMVMFLYGHSEDQVRMEPDKANEIYVKIAKHRNGGLDNIQFYYDKDYQTFSDKGKAVEKFLKPIHSDDPF